MTEDEKKEFEEFLEWKAVIQNFKVWKVIKYAAYILTIRDSKKYPKLHKYTLRLYIYAVLEYWISEGEQGVIWWEAQIFPIKNPPLMDRIYFKLKSEKFRMAP